MKKLLRALKYTSAQFSISKIIRIFLNFFSLKNINLGAHFLITSISKSLYFLKWCPIFDTSPFTQFSKFNNFLWVCWFLGKKPPFANSTTRIAIINVLMVNKNCHFLNLPTQSSAYVIYKWYLRIPTVEPIRKSMKHPL